MITVETERKRSDDKGIRRLMFWSVERKRSDEKGREGRKTKLWIIERKRSDDKGSRRLKLCRVEEEELGVMAEDVEDSCCGV
jgi:hypothetical protein